MYKILVRKPEGKRLLGRLDVHGRIILKWVLWRYGGRMYWIHLAQGRDRWQTVVNTVMNLLVPLKG
jgi:hypothetical protein